MASERGNVELGLLGKATVVDGTLFFGPRCTRISSENRRCGKPAHYEFELDPRNWPNVTPPIIQYACVEHAREARTMMGIVRFITI